MFRVYLGCRKNVFNEETDTHKLYQKNDSEIER